MIRFFIQVRWKGNAFVKGGFWKEAADVYDLAAKVLPDIFKPQVHEYLIVHTVKQEGAGLLTDKKWYFDIDGLEESQGNGIS